jgi:hypothetical protein
MTLRPEGIVYLAGIAVLGLAQAPLRERFSGPVFFSIALVYLVALRGLGWYLQRRKSQRTEDSDV